MLRFLMRQLVKLNGIKDFLARLSHSLASIAEEIGVWLRKELV
jgi:hypothetical protein